jgi:serine/threonine protein kinase
MPSGKRVSDPAEFLRLLRASNILTPGQLQLATRLAQQTPDCKMLARRLIAKTLLTRWQASQLLVGWHRLRLGKYKLCRQIGRGQLGRVFLAEHIQLGRQVAIKTLSRRFTREKQIVEQFLAEASRVSQLDHPNILHLFDIDRDADQYYLIMEYVVGQDLETLVEEAGPQAFPRIAELVCQAARGLAHAHHLGAVHGGLRPASVMVDQQGTVKILDFGFGQLGQRLAAADSNEAARPGDGQPAGYLGSDQKRGGYLAPEQKQEGQGDDARVDIYALGGIAYWLTTGCPPSAAGQPDALTTLRTDVPQPFAARVEKMINPDPQQRFQRAEQVVAAWEEYLAEVSGGAATPDSQEELFPEPAFLQGLGQSRGQSAGHQEPTPPPPEPEPKRWSHRLTRWPVLLAAAACMLLAAAVAGGLWMLGDSRPAAGAKSARPIAPGSPSGAAVAARSDAGRQPRQKPPVVSSSLPQVGAVREADQPAGIKKLAAEPSGPEMAAPADSQQATDAPSASQPLQQSSSPQSESAGAPGGQAARPPDPGLAEPPNQQPPAKAADAAAKAAGDQPQPAPDQPPGTDVTPSDKPPASAAEPEPKPEPKPKPAPNPLEALPARIGLPLPTDPPESAVSIGPLELAGDQVLQMSLLGGETAVNRQATFHLVPSEDPAELAWRIELREATADGPLDVAHLEVRSGQLQFGWQDEAHRRSTAAHLVNCVLRLQSPPHRCDIRLREPQHVDPLLVNLRRVTVDVSTKVVVPPDPAAVRFQISSLQPPLPDQYVVEPAEPVPVDGEQAQPVWVTLGATPDEHVVKFQLEPSLGRMFRLRGTAYFQFDPRAKPELLNSKNMTMADQLITKNQLMHNANALRVRNEYKKLGRQDPRREAKKRELDRVEAELQKAAALTHKLELLKKWRAELKDGGPIHFRVFFVAGDCEVELLTTALDQL